MFKKKSVQEFIAKLKIRNSSHRGLWKNKNWQIQVLLTEKKDNKIASHEQKLSI